MPKFENSISTDGRVTGGAVAITFAATLPTDCSRGNTFSFTATASFTLANPTNATIDGQKVSWRIKQDTTGSRLISFDTKFRFGTDLPSTSVVLSTTVSKTDYLGAIYNLTDDKWDVVSFIRGF